MSAFYDLNKTPRNILNQAIVRAIISENNGAWFDPEDMSTMFQDAAGTTPVTALEQPVGRWLDKSGNGNHATQSMTASRPVISARYNQLLNSAALSTQSVTTVAAPYTLSFTGTGSVTLSGSATGALAGTGVNNRVSLSITPTAGTLMLTVTGSVTLAMLAFGTLTTYQAITTATSYDSVGWPKYLLFDGIDDALLYDSPYALGSNPSTHILAATPIQQILTNRGFFTINPTSTVSNTQRSVCFETVNSVKADCRNAPVVIVTTGAMLGTTRIFSAVFGGAKKAALAINGAAYTLFVGTIKPNTRATDSVLGSGLTKLPLGFALYGFISTGSDLGDTDRRRCEQFLASRLSTLGVTLS